MALSNNISFAVIIDKRRDPKAETGLFELIYKQSLPRPPAYLGMNLSVRGRRIFRNRNKSHPKAEKEKENETLYKSKGLPPALTKVIENNGGSSKLPKIFSPEHYKGPVIADFIEELHNTFSCEHNGVDFVSPVSPPPVKKNKNLGNNKNNNNKERVLKGSFVRKCKVNKSLSLPRRRKISENKAAETLCTVWSNIKYDGEKFEKIRTCWERETNSILVGKTIKLGDNADFNKNSVKVSRSLSCLSLPQDDFKSKHLLNVGNYQKSFKKITNYTAE